MIIDSTVGQLTIRPLCAVFCEDVKASGRANPYVEIGIGNQRLSCCVATQQGINPAWVDRIDYNLNKESEVEVFAYDDEFRRKEDFIGTCKIKLADPLKNRDHIQLYDIFRQGYKTGKLKIAFQFVPKASPVVSI